MPWDFLNNKIISAFACPLTGAGKWKATIKIMTNYELLYIVSGQYSENELADIRKKVDNIIKKYEGTIGDQEFLGKKKLAYPIKKVAHGYYVVTEFELAETENFKEILKNLKLDKEILRSQIINKPRTIKKKAAAKKPRIQPQAKTAVEIKDKKPAKAIESKKVSMKDLDEKLDEIFKEEEIL